jgi:hypothetical protein
MRELSLRTLPKPVAVEDLSEDDREILESVSTVPLPVLRVRVFWGIELSKPNRSFTDGPICWNAVARCVGPRPSLMRRAFRCRPLRVWSIGGAPWFLEAECCT